MYGFFPKQQAWAELYEVLQDGWANAGRPGVPPPAPPNIDIWDRLPNAVKKASWQRMVQWLERQDALEVLADLACLDWDTIGKRYIADVGSRRHAPYGLDPLLVSGSRG